MSVVPLLKQTNSPGDKHCIDSIQEYNIVLINVNVHSVTKVRLKMNLLAEFERAFESGSEGFCLVSSSLPENKNKMDKSSVNEVALKCSKTVNNRQQ